MAVAGNIKIYSRFLRTTAVGTTTIVPLSAIWELGTTEYALNSGTGANQVDLIWTSSRTFVSSTPITLDFRSLTADNGTAVFSKIKLIHAVNEESVTARKLTYGNDGGSNTWFAPWSGATVTQEHPPGSPFILANFVDGWVADATHKDFKVANGAYAVVWKILIAGNA